MTLAINAWKYELHPEVWVLVASLIGLGWYAAKVIGPKVVTDGPVVTRRNKIAFGFAVALLWLAADWPMHDIAEKYLYSVHMVQHMLISFVVPPLILLAVPEWLARLIVLDGGPASKVLQRLTHPIVAGVIFNAVAALTHWEVIVNLSVENGPFHYAAHLVVFFSSLLMWNVVVGPIPEQRLPPMGRALFLFIMSIIPTVPAGWLTFAEGAVYSAYDTPDRLWGISVASDQQMAGLVMKVLGGLYLWGWIATIFFRHVGGQVDADRAKRRYRPDPLVIDADDPASGTGGPADTGPDGAGLDPDAELTFAAVQAEFDRSTAPDSSAN